MRTGKKRGLTEDWGGLEGTGPVEVKSWDPSEDKGWGGNGA